MSWLISISSLDKKGNNKNASLCGGFCAFDWKESRHICWVFLFSFCPENWCHKSILLIINPQGHERGGPCQNIKISSWACHSLSLSYIDYLGSRLCRLYKMYIVYWPIFFNRKIGSKLIHHVSKVSDYEFYQLIWNMRSVV